MLIKKYKKIAGLLAACLLASAGTMSQVSAEELPTTYTVYISGIDNRGELIEHSRSDVNIIATVNTDTCQCLLVNTPRDYYVPLSISNGVPDKLTHAGNYGVKVSMDTLGMLYDREIPYYFRINFGGFVQLIDSLGGIDVYSDYDFTAQNGGGGYHFVQGENHLDGEQALSFARERYAFAAGDRQRGRNQMEVIKAVAKKLMQGNVVENLTNILKMSGTLFETNVSLADILKVASAGGDWNITSYSVDGTGDSRIPYSMSQYAYVMVPDQSTVDHAKELMDTVLSGGTPEV